MILVLIDVDFQLLSAVERPIPPISRAVSTALAAGALSLLKYFKDELNWNFLHLRLSQWEEVVKSYSEYYYNRLTGETAWIAPEDYISQPFFSSPCHSSALRISRLL